MNTIVRRLNPTLKTMILASTVMIILSVVFFFAYRICDEVWMLSVYVTFLTISYHFVMRLIVGETVTRIYADRDFRLDTFFFRIRSFEPGLYKRIKVKNWKTKAITAKPEQFDMKRTSRELLLHNMAQAELVHRIIMVLSFLPLLLIIPYGVPGVFIITSIFACIIDLRYVIIQRYNRPRLVRLIRRSSERASSVIDQRERNYEEF